jgi:cephalosporin hydroxylase
MTDKSELFEKETKNRITKQGLNNEIKNSAQDFFSLSHKNKYSYNFSWLGRPIIQYPQDIVALQEIIFNVQPDLIIETGIAHGGSLIFSASMLTLLDAMEGIDSKNSDRKVVGVDIDIRNHNKKEIIKHPFYHKIKLIEGSSTDEKTIKKVEKYFNKDKKTLVCLDSNHTTDHVLKELDNYAKFVSINSYCIVCDTCLQFVSEESFVGRPWSNKNNPLVATLKWLKRNENFKADKSIDNKLLISAAPNGFLKRIK